MPAERLVCSQCGHHGLVVGASTVCPACNSSYPTDPLRKGGPNRYLTQARDSITKIRKGVPKKIRRPEAQ
jgi:hypothetical protein